MPQTGPTIFSNCLLFCSLAQKRYLNCMEKFRGQPRSLIHCLPACLFPCLDFANPKVRNELFISVSLLLNTHLAHDRWLNEWLKNEWTNEYTNVSLPLVTLLEGSSLTLRIVNYFKPAAYFHALCNLSVTSHTCVSELTEEKRWRVWEVGREESCTWMV
jgi:hypothetical protein